jgi:L-aspartate oxidase
MGRQNLQQTDFLIIGSGVAGLRAAIELAGAGAVSVITKGAVAEGSTWRAQGGIAVALAEGDEPGLHMKDTLRAGAGLCDEEAVRVLVEEGVPCVKELISWGAKFDEENGHLSFTQEAAHEIRRIIHAMGDATGEEVHRTLMRKARGIKNIKFLEHTFLVDLVTDEKECSGALVIDKNGRTQIISAGATILASGGLGQLYKDTTNPDVATGDGLAVAWRAGCELQDMEFVQFHPTTLYLPSAPCFLISESVRGEGGILRNSEGKTFMAEYHEMGDLAPRDVVSRAIFSQMWRTGSESVFLDMTHLKPGFLQKRFPNIYSTCKEYGLDIANDLIPVRPAAHFLMGGVRTSLTAETSVKRLLSCGEVASVGVHGANRLASNSLLEGLVFGKRAGASAARYSGRAIAVGKGSLGKKAKLKEKPDLKHMRKSLKQLMEQKAGIVRCGKSLKEALEKLEEWDKIAGGACASIEEFELRNMIAVARLITASALKREESRGAHYRSDCPNTDDKHWKKHIVIKRREK